MQPAGKSVLESTGMVSRRLPKGRVAVQALGCKVNQYEAEAVAGMFERRGYSVVPFESCADVYLVNTCTVTASADRKSRQLIHRASRANPGALVIVMGCYSELAPGEVAAMPGVRLVLGTRGRSDVVDLVDEVVRNDTTLVKAGVGRAWEKRPVFEDIPGRWLRDSRCRAMLKIQDGCGQRCSYCAIPHARGPSRSRVLDSIVLEAKRLAEAGCRELVLTGVHLGSYGRDLRPQVHLAEVLAAVCEVDGVWRVRLSSIEPTEIDAPVIDAVKQLPEACKHFHIPLQSGDDSILEAMNRPYRVRDFQDAAERLRAALPEAAVTTDVMVGFPGESTRQFQNTLEVVRRVGFTRLHVFKYSPRRGTPAAGMGGEVEERLKAARSRELVALGRELSLSYHRGFLGRSLQVMIERERGRDVWEGLSGTYVRVRASAGVSPCMIGETVEVEIESVSHDGAEGHIVGCSGRP
ncbi:MAG: tRNA (N(6)-L-threonylcarbamoyladenosine(37)-C(2))-methylthiotransferase MtaB [Firmicutes bacterium]|nr:tRNA (N(6)-L-threonylcarbamoyladenosine(37)-C(2))-methylthiotransferase MtaB [Bacillota bacterium]